MNVPALSILFLVLPLNVMASQISCDSLVDILDRKPANEALATIKIATFVRWHKNKKFEKCEWNSVEKYTQCGSKRFVGGPQDLILSYGVLTKSGDEIESETSGFKNPPEKTYCYLTSKGYKRVFVNQAILKIKDAPIFYTVKTVKMRQAPFSTMRF